jgi:hypothetical protein
MTNSEKYNKIKRSNISSLITNNIKTHIPTPAEIDYRRGHITRYFVQKTNDKASPIYEVNYTEFMRLNTKPLFTIVLLKWRISGPKETQYDLVGNIMDKGVKESNRIAIFLVADKIPNLKLYLPNLLQFYK